MKDTPAVGRLRNWALKRKTKNLRIALAQINSHLGDFEFNFDKILSFTLRAFERRCDLVLFPEASLFGYHPVDLLERASVVAEQEKYISRLTKELPKGVGIIIGAIVPNATKRGKAYWNAAVLIERGKKPQIFPKQLLPTYDVFDESRHIQPGDTTKNVFTFKGQRILMTICEDIWAWPLKKGPQYSRYGDNPIKKIKKGKVDLVLNMSASPFTETKFADRRFVTGETVKHLGVPLVYVNMVGAQDELIFDGGSFALNAKRKVIAQCVRFDEDLNVLDLESEDASVLEVPDEGMETVRRALVLGLKDFITKTGFTKVHLGLSGGVDSAVVACLVADAIGPMNVHAIGMRGPFTSPDSVKLAKQLAENLHIGWTDLSIEDMYKQSVAEFERGFGPQKFGLMQENIQARCRGLLLMAYSNNQNSLLIGTSNKTELAVGYSTLYGDMCAGIMPIGDLLKSEIYDLARHYNSEFELIPKKIIERPASAELREGQKTEESLLPFKQLDPAIRNLVEDLNAPKTELDKRVLKMLFASEFKRWQAAPILKISNHAFGRGRRLPIAHKARF